MYLRGVKRLGYAILMLFAGVVYTVVIGHTWRELSYRWTLAVYSKTFKLGESREHVEDYLFNKGVSFTPMVLAKDEVLNFHGGLPRGPSDPPLALAKAPPADVIKIGEEFSSIVCGKNDVVIVIEFILQPGNVPDERGRPRPSDRLNEISLSRQPGACL